jgi:P4 family phage/plasmid primase-like protien
MGTPAVSDQAKEVSSPPSGGTSATPALEAALAYAQDGLDVYPVWQGGDGGKPKAPGCSHGYKDATHDPAEIHRWWSPGSVFGVAMRTGVLSDGPLKDMCLLVIDIDDKGAANGSEMLRRYLDGELDGRPHKLPPTLEQRSWSGGKHLFYLSEEPRGCTQNGHLHIDVRGTGGGIVVAPTRITMPDGRSGQYEWVGGFDLSRIAEADEEVESLVDFVFDYGRKKAGKPASDNEVRPRYVRPDHVPCGGRHKELLSYAASLWALGYSEAEILGMCLEFARSACDQPEGDEIGVSEILAILDWVFSMPRRSDSVSQVPPQDDVSEDAGVGDGPSEREVADRELVRQLLEEYDVYVPKKNGDRQLRKDRLSDMFLYGLHACTIGGAPALWDGTRYKFGVPAFRYFVELACPQLDDSANNGTVKKVRALLEGSRKFDLPSPYIVRFENGVLDLEARQFKTAGKVSWRDRVTNEIPHPYDPDATPVAEVDRWLDVLADGHDDVRSNLLQVIFLCMTRIVKHEQAAVLIGDGANGKSKFVDVVVRVVGEDNVSTLGLDRMGDHFEKGEMAGKLVNISSDISSSYLSGDSAATWKQVTGGDLIHAGVKFQSPFNFRAFCTLIVVANKFPKLEGGIDKATARRLHVIPFTANFKNADGSYNDSADPDIVEKVCQPDAMAYLIRLAVEEGYRMLDQREFRLTPNYASADEVHKLAVDNSSVLAWTEHVGMKAEDLHMQRASLMYGRYSAWCKRGSMKPVALTRFYDEILALFPGLERMKVRATKQKVLYGRRPQEMGKVQYSAFVDGALYEREREVGTAYVEVTSERRTLTSYSRGAMDTRENCRVDEVDLGVWPLPGLSLDELMDTGWNPIARNDERLDKMFENLARYEG